MSHVVSIPLPKATFTFTVTHDGECGLWVGVCDDLCVATEAPTYGALVERVWQITLEHGLNLFEVHLRLLFQPRQSAWPWRPESWPSGALQTNRPFVDQTKKKGLHCCKPLILLGFFWLPDLDSNQGPAD